MPIEVSVHDVGPLERAEVSLSPLTLMVGPNNSGKSVLAMLAYAATRAGSTGDLWIRPSSYRAYQLGRLRRQTGPLFDPERFAEFVPELKLQLTHYGSGARITLSRPLAEMLSQVVHSLLEDYSLVLVEEVERCFGERFRELSRVTSAARHLSPSLTIRSLNPRWSVRVDSSGRANNARVEFELEPRRLLRHMVASISSFLGPRFDADDPKLDIPLTLLPQLVASGARSYCFESFPRNSYYLPAARSGFLQSHRALASFVVSRASLVGIEDMAIPKLTGVVGDFIGTLLRIDSSDKGDYADCANKLEAEVLDGTVRLRSEPSGYPEISYRWNEVEFPLHRTSSMVSELAPIVLYLRHVLQRKNLLIVEEPESHLHPESQRKLATILAMMAADDLNILLTTHSDYFLRALNNAIRSGAFVEGRDIRHAAEVSTKPVAAYLFSEPKESKGGSSGTRTTRLRVTSEEGVPAREFDRVAEALYRETVELDRRLGGFGG